MRRKPPIPSPEEEQVQPKTSQDWLKVMELMRRRKPSGLRKRFGRQGPTPAQLVAYNFEVRLWNAQYGRARRRWKECLAREQA